MADAELLVHAVGFDEEGSRTARRVQDDIVGLADTPARHGPGQSWLCVVLAQIVAALRADEPLEDRSEDVAGDQIDVEAFDECQQFPPVGHCFLGGIPEDPLGDLADHQDGLVVAADVHRFIEGADHRLAQCLWRLGCHTAQGCFDGGEVTAQNLLKQHRGQDFGDALGDEVAPLLRMTQIQPCSQCPLVDPGGHRRKRGIERFV
ncbi:Uncharacterised protein [Mycobacteroides abscessus subsp. abscessus]|nr:Uncharacterised protein [Mycobacteroides abscessus subsp. abscessus]SHZ92286.1 Uncharacterised protein [Mycobacteroides abscessus subsp. abscessus]SIB16444.1 Uncharacterised protein [Mycobacteroides abscessus subsp. abscessus]SIE88596.1 Uncharacterised protein [Mycobacteroides abscessus subsp. abscessus]SKD12517.1 Uncharacterised protein [Mycobacteroides abscessus subsp. abscessus]